MLKPCAPGSQSVDLYFLRRLRAFGVSTTILLLLLLTVQCLAAQNGFELLVLHTVSPTPVSLDLGFSCKDERDYYLKDQETNHQMISRFPVAFRGPSQMGFTTINITIKPHRINTLLHYISCTVCNEFKLGYSSMIDVGKQLPLIV